MSTFREFEPDEQDLPEGWDPATDRDPRWQTIVDLARKADRPQMPYPAVFQAVKMETRRTLLQEGLLRETTNEKTPLGADLGFAAWLRLMLLGGRAGGQFVRLGFVGAVAFLAGVQLTETYSPENLAPTAVAEKNTPAVTSRVVASADAPREATAAPRGITVPKTIHGGDDWSTALPGSSGWMVNQRPAMHSVGLAADQSMANGQPPTDLASEALDQLQVLKFYSLVDRDERALAELRRVEQTVSQIMQDGDKHENPRVEALESYRRGEQALAAQRYHDAQAAFGRAANLMPASSLAFLSHFQVGRISYEHTQDYALALESFRKCVEDYPAHFMSDEHKVYLLDRIEILNQTAADDWQSIMNWQAAERMPNSPVAVPHLIQVVKRGSSPKLASDAALRLKDILIADSIRREVDHREVIDVLRARVERAPLIAETARIQFALAEIVARRSQNLGQAMAEYGSVLEMNPDEQTLRLTRSRLNLLMNQRLTGIRAID